MELATGRILSGEDAPHPNNVYQWLEANVGWRLVESDDENEETEYLQCEYFAAYFIQL